MHHVTSKLDVIAQNLENGFIVVTITQSGTKHPLFQGKWDIAAQNKVAEIIRQNRKERTTTLFYEVYTARNAHALTFTKGDMRVEQKLRIKLKNMGIAAGVACRILITTDEKLGFLDMSANDDTIDFAALFLQKHGGNVHLNSYQKTSDGTIPLEKSLSQKIRYRVSGERKTARLVPF